MNCCFYLFKRVISYKNNVNTIIYNLLLANLSVNGMPAIDDFFFISLYSFKPSLSTQCIRAIESKSKCKFLKRQTKSARME